MTSGPIITEIDRLFDLRIAAGTLYKQLADKYGAEEANVYDRTGTFAGFVFKVPPDKNVYRCDAKTLLWLPRKNVPAGKAIWAEIKQLPTPEPIENAMKLAGLTPGLPMLTDAGRWYAPTIWGYGAPRNIWFVSVPWLDVDPDKIAAYEAEKAEGKCFDQDLEALTWQPPVEWEEVKRWQIEKEDEEIKASKPD